MTAADGLRLRGLFMPPQRGKPVLVHVHGNSGNFYENPFLDIMAQEYSKAGLGFLIFNNRGHDVIAEAYRFDHICYIGGAVESYAESFFDLQAAMDFARQHSAVVLLQGHSFGCLKIVNYLSKSEQAIDAVLLSPADTLQLQRDFIYTESLEDQIKRLRREYCGSLQQLLPTKEFGIREGTTEYLIPISAGTFLELFQSTFAEKLSYSTPIDYYLKSAVFVYCGAADPLLTSSMETIKTFFERRFRTVRFCVERAGNHHLRSVEQKVAQKIARWVLDQVI